MFTHSFPILVLDPECAALFPDMDTSIEVEYEYEYDRHPSVMIDSIISRPSGEDFTGKWKWLDSYCIAECEEHEEAKRQESADYLMRDKSERY